MAYEMMGGFSKVGWSLLKVVYFALATFVASVIFWLTYKWLVENKKRRKKK